MRFMGLPASAARARQERRVYYGRRLKWILLAFACLVLALAGLAALVAGLTEGAGFAPLPAAAFLFFGGSFAAIVWRLRRRRPVLVMDAEGLTIWLGSGRPEHVDWDAISEVHIFPAPRMQVLGIVHRAHYRYGERTLFGRRAERHLAAPELAIPSVSIAAPLRRVEAEIRRRVPL